jgi:hypothetical protein
MLWEGLDRQKNVHSILVSYIILQIHRMNLVIPTRIVSVMLSKSRRKTMQTPMIIKTITAKDALLGNLLEQNTRVNLFLLRGNIPMNYATPKMKSETP